MQALLALKAAHHHRHLAPTHSAAPTTSATFLPTSPQPVTQERKSTAQATPFGWPCSCSVPIPTQGAFMAAAAKLNMSAASASTFSVGLPAPWPARTSMRDTCIHQVKSKFSAKRTKNQMLYASQVLNS